MSEPYSDLRALIEPSSPAASASEEERKSAVQEVLNLLDQGKVRVAEKRNGKWEVNLWVKKAILLSFRLKPNRKVVGAPDNGAWWDKVDSKCARWEEADFRRAGFRSVPGAVVRHSAYIAPDVVLMPCFVNVGAHVGEGTMVDTWATIGSGAQVGRNVHVSGGAGIAGVLEPLQAAPVIIEDNCFIGARAEVAEGVIVESGAVLSMGVYIGASTKVIDRASGEVYQGRVPAGAVVVPGTLPGKPLPSGEPGPGLYCGVIVKRVDEKTRAKLSLNELLRD